MCSREKRKEFPLEGSRGKLVRGSSLACRIFETQINTALLVTLSADLVGAPFSSDYRLVLSCVAPSSISLLSRNLSPIGEKFP
ncbi:hypothetical protein CEXT_711621 [Caerostris extrusa]|uniref:Uncharacterized protein n=1 Tax=Caerostris extrusa TaxID=172846 RepID=A0AAV4N453_CAEEX|nr:hypothetical protein CEXT_711621 [Caerostris extrusa]